jgi:hypothetical protein
MVLVDTGAQAFCAFNNSQISIIALSWHEMSCIHGHEYCPIISRLPVASAKCGVTWMQYRVPACGQCYGIQLTLWTSVNK